MPWSVRITLLLLLLPAGVLVWNLLGAPFGRSSFMRRQLIEHLVLCAVLVGLCVALCVRWRLAWHMTRWFALLVIAYEAASAVARAAGGIADVESLALALGLAIAPPIAILVSLGRPSAREHFGT